jgi:hypothetical protein
VWNFKIMFLPSESDSGDKDLGCRKALNFKIMFLHCEGDSRGGDSILAYIIEMLFVVSEVIIIDQEEGGRKTCNIVQGNAVFEQGVK